MERSVWRDSARSVRCGPLDARAFSGLAVWMVHMSVVTLALSAAVMIVFLVLGRHGVSVPAAWRSCRTLLFPGRRSSDSRYMELRRLR